MSLSPINTGSARQLKISLQNDWELSINDFNMDVLTCAVKGTLASMLALCPTKYQPPKNISFPAGVNFNSLSCSSRKIVPGEGLSAVGNLEFKGFVKEARNPVSSLTWLTALHEVIIPNVATFNFMIPTAAQLTVKFGNTKKYQCAIGKVGIPSGAENVPDTFNVEVSSPAGAITTLAVFAPTAKWICEKHDKQEAGKYTEETQVWSRTYIVLI